MPAGDIGVGGREIGFLFGQYKRLTTSYERACSPARAWRTAARWSAPRPPATAWSTSCRKCSRSARPSGRQDLHGLRLRQRGHLRHREGPAARRQGRRLSDSNGYIYDEKGINLALVKQLKEVERRRIKDYANTHKHARYVEAAATSGTSPATSPCPAPPRTRSTGKAAETLVKNGCIAVAEGANMPTTPEGVAVFLKAKIAFGPAKAANAGGVATSALEMQQNACRDSWTFEFTEKRLADIMHNIHQTCYETAEGYGTPGNYVNGANIAGFIKVATAMAAHGVI